MRTPTSLLTLFLASILLLIPGCVPADESGTATANDEWETTFFDDFDTFNPEYWQDQLLWVNNEDQCYVRDGAHGTREVSDGTLKIRVVDMGEPVECEGLSKTGEVHPPSPFVAGRIITKNRVERIKGRWTARLRVPDSGQEGMFPAWWILGAQVNEEPIEDADETVCWPLTGAGEVDIFEHHSDGGPDHYAARAIKSMGTCGGGDWQQLMHVQAAELAEYHDYGVEWSGSDLLFLLDGEVIYTLEGGGDELPEPFFAILNFAKIKPGPMTSPSWTMEVDWVRHEQRIGS